MRRRSPAVVVREVDFEPITPPPGLPGGLVHGEYIAVKAYFSSSFPDTPQNRSALRALLERLTRHGPVVLLGGGGVDEHEHPELSGIGLVAQPPEAWVPNANLAERPGSSAAQECSWPPTAGSPTWARSWACPHAPSTPTTFSTRCTWTCSARPAWPGGRRRLAPQRASRLRHPTSRPDRPARRGAGRSAVRRLSGNPGQPAR